METRLNQTTSRRRTVALKCKASLSAHDILIVHTHVDPETVFFSSLHTVCSVSCWGAVWLYLQEVVRLHGTICPPVWSRSLGLP